MSKYGYFSAQAAKLHGTVYWKNLTGQEVEVTAVGNRPNPKEIGYIWPDAVGVGEVTEWSRGAIAASVKLPAKWLNGWTPLNNSSVLIGSGVHCIGCGKDRGVTCVALAEDWKPPEKLPDWPFSQNACPVCEFKQLYDKCRDASREDKLTARLLALHRKSFL